MIEFCIELGIRNKRNRYMKIIRIDECGEPYAIEIDDEIMNLIPPGYSLEFTGYSTLELARIFLKEESPELLEHKFFLLKLQHDSFLKKMEEKFCQSR